MDLWPFYFVFNSSPTPEGRQLVPSSVFMTHAFEIPSVITEQTGEAWLARNANHLSPHCAICPSGKEGGEGTHPVLTPLLPCDSTRVPAGQNKPF